MSFPQFPDKHLKESLVSPRKHLEALKCAGAPIPPTILFCYPHGLFRRLCQEFPVSRMDGAGFPLASLRRLDRPEGPIGLVHAPSGAPMAALLAELYIALGAKRIIGLGTAGALADLEIGEVVLSDEAIRDEGVSHHYLEPGARIRASAECVSETQTRLESRGIRFRRGCVWTTDAPYRETSEEVREYREQGVLCVDMETAALCAVAQARAVSCLSVLVVSDRLDALQWTPELDSPKVSASLWACASALLES